jgi:hypothetical protein
MKQIKNYLFIITHLAKLRSVNPSNLVLIENPSERDYRDLATGRWVNFKAINALDFTIGLTRDAEGMLMSYVNQTHFNGKSLTGHQFLKNVDIMINISLDCLNCGGNIVSYIEELEKLNTRG